MSDEINVAVAKALEIFEERQAAKEAEQNALAEALADARLEGYEAGKVEKEAEMKAWKEERGSFSTPEVTELGSGGEEGDVKAFAHWMRTGDNIAARKSLVEVQLAAAEGKALDPETAKALQEGTGSEGGFLVPDDFVADIVELRDPLSFPRQMGVRVVPTNRDVIDIPAESTSLAVFGRVAEEGNAASDDGAFAQNQITVHKWMKATRFSTELLEDDAAGLESLYADAIARAMAKTEAQYVGTGSGTNQHQGIMVGGDTDAITFNTDNGADSDGNLLADALWHMYYTLGEGYRSDAAWLCSPATARLLVSLRHTQASPGWAFGAADMLSFNSGVGNPISVLGKPLYSDSNVANKAANTAFIAFGSPAYYALVERKGLSIFRDPYTRRSQGQIVFISEFRQGGAVLAEAAWAIGQGA